MKKYFRVFAPFKRVFTPLIVRRLLDATITFTIASLLMINGAGPWSMLTIPLSIWAHHDGATRRDLIASDRMNRS